MEAVLKPKKEIIMAEHKPGDIVMTFGNPIKCTYPIGQAKLIKKIGDHQHMLENWSVEYLDDEGHFYNTLIRKNNGNI